MIRENPFTHHQMFIKCTVWVEHYARLSGVTKKLEMLYQQIDEELQRQDWVLNWCLFLSDIWCRGFVMDKLGGCSTFLAPTLYILPSSLITKTTRNAPTSV